MAVPKLRALITFGAAQYDVGDYLLSYSSNRGRSSRVESIQPGMATIQLINDDGRFSQGLTSSPYYPYVTRWTPIVVQAFVSGSWRTRFTGYVSAWPVGLSETGLASIATITIVDRSTRDSLQDLDSRAVGVLRDWGATLQWPLTADGAEVSGGPSLAPIQIGAGGELQWGQGPSPASSEGAILQVANINATNGKYLEVVGALASTPLTIIMATSDPNGLLLEAAFGSPAGSGSSGGAILRISGTPSSWTAASGPTTIFTAPARPGLWLAMITISVANDPVVTLRGGGSAPMGLFTGGGPITMDLTSLRIAGGADAALVSGALGQVAIIPRLLSAIEMEQLAADMESATIDLSNVLAWGGMPATIVGAPDGLRVGTVGGQSAQSLIDLCAEGAPARYFIDRAGVPTWRPIGEAPTAVVIPATAEPDPGLGWSVDLGSWITDVDVAMADGTTWRWSNPAVTTGRSSSGIDQVWEDPERSKSAARWIGSADEAPRLEGLTFDLTPLSAADALTVALREIGDWITVSGLPVQIPGGAQTVVIEGYQESIDAHSWVVDLDVSTAPNFFIIGSSLLDGPDILAP